MELREQIGIVLRAYKTSGISEREAVETILKQPTIRDALAHKKEYDGRRPTDFDTLNARKRLAAAQPK